MEEAEATSQDLRGLKGPLLVEAPPDLAPPPFSSSCALFKKGLRQPPPPAERIRDLAAARGARLGLELLALRGIIAPSRGTGDIEELTEKCISGLREWDAEGWTSPVAQEETPEKKVSADLHNLTNPVVLRPPRSSTLEKDARDIQVTRDVERDIFDIDGRIVRGSEGFIKVRETLCDRLSERTQEVNWWSLPPPEQLCEFASLVLRAANRTESGGQSFDTLQRFVANHLDCGETIIVPDSASAEPLRIRTSAGCFTHPPSAAVWEALQSSSLVSRERMKSWYSTGIRCQLEAQTVYRLYQGDVDAPPFATARVTYFHRIMMPLSPPHRQDVLTFDGLNFNRCEARIEVSFQFQEGAHLESLKEQTKRSDSSPEGLAYEPPTVGDVIQVKGLFDRLQKPLSIQTGKNNDGEIDDGSFGGIDFARAPRLLKALLSPTSQQQQGQQQHHGSKEQHRRRKEEDTASKSEALHLLDRFAQ